MIWFPTLIFRELPSIKYTICAGTCEERPSAFAAQIVYLIDGSSRKIKVGNQIIHFKHAGPRALLGAGTPAGVALQAIRAFGPDHLTDGVIRQLRQNLPSDAKTGLKKLAHHAPQWMASAIDAVTA